MKRSRFTDSQIITILKQAEAGTPVLNCAGSMASAVPVFINGAQSLAGWMLH
jgi:hypothetical protein